VKVIKYKLFFTGGYEKEELWLNEMSRKGLQLIEVPNGIRYIFESDETRCYEYQLEHLDESPSDIKNLEHIEALKQQNIEYVCSFNNWVYFRKDAALGTFVLHPDLDSKIDHYKRLLTVTGFLVLNMLVLAINSLCTLLNIYVLNLVITILLGFSFLVALFSLAQVYARLRKLKQKKKSQS